MHRSPTYMDLHVKTIIELKINYVKQKLLFLSMNKTNKIVYDGFLNRPITDDLRLAGKFVSTTLAH